MTIPTFTPLRENLGQQVYQHLRDKICALEIPPGARLGVSEVADQLSVSRSPVRDALIMLVNDGIVELGATGAYRVIQFDRAYVQDAFIVRRALELAAIPLAMANLNRARIEQLRAVWAALETRVDTDPAHLSDYLRADQELHQTIAEMSNNHLLQSALDRITLITWLISRFTYTAGAPQRHYGALTAQEHLRLLDAMLAGNVEQAVTALDDHLTRAFARSLERLDAAHAK